MAKWEGFSEEDIKKVGAGERKEVCMAKHKANAAQHPGVKNVTRSRMLLKSQKPEDLDGHTEEIPAEAFLCKPQAVTDSADSAEIGSDSGCGVSSSTSSLTASPSHGTVCLRIKEGKNYEILNAEEVGTSCFLDEFQSKQKFMEEQNRQRKELLTKALADRKRQTTAEAVRLQQIQDELQKLDALLSNDVSILRDQIEVASREFMEAQKRYSEAEKEFLDAKLLLFERLERKELLTEHLCTIIEQNELRKARKLSELMNRLQLGENEDDQKTAAKNMTLLPHCALDEVSYSVCSTLKPTKVVGESEICERSQAECDSSPTEIQN